MIIREPCLPPGWYPRDKGKIVEFLEPFAKRGGDAVSAFAAIAPHAGWYYSGLTATASVSFLDTEVETVAIIGGHLGANMPVLIAAEDAVKTPFGNMEIDKELREKFQKQVSFGSDRYADNTVEVLLPMVHYFFPNASLLWLRFPADISSFEAGILLEEAASSLGRKLAVIASTDLTHYGANYGFSPKGRGKPALEWVKQVNDAAFIAAVLEKNPSLVLKRAEEDSSACSAGAVLGALGFAASLVQEPAGNLKARLLDYRTSADVGDSENVPDSFVGYAAITFRK